MLCNMYFVCAAVFGLPLLAILIYRRVRPYFSIKVNCWFCGENTIVPYGNKNCWDCPYCEQYNGFNEDGDYNKEIPAQSCESLNFPTMGADGRIEKYPFNFSNILCSECNFNQQVKVKLLAEFVPFNESKFDEEVSLYQRHLEKTYALCWKCTVRVKKELTEQDAKMCTDMPENLLFKNDTKNDIDVRLAQNGPLNIGVLGLSGIALLCTSILLFVSAMELQEKLSWNIMPKVDGLRDFQYSIVLSLVGMFSEVGAVLFAGKHRLHFINVVSGLLLTALQSLYSPLIIGCISATHLHMSRPILALTALFVSLAGTVTRNRQNNQVSNAAASWRKAFNPRTLPHVKPHQTDQYTLISATKHEVPLSDKLSEISRGKKYDPLSASLRQIYITTPTKQQHSYENFDNQKLNAVATSWRPKSVVHPARLTNIKSVTQTSWVAGGYWSNPHAKSITGADSLRAADQWPSWNGLLTPPPSVNGSQESQNVSPTASMCGDDVRSVFSEPVIRRRSGIPSIRSWPPSISRVNRPWNVEHDTFCHCCHCHSPTMDYSSNSNQSSPVTQRSWNSSLHASDSCHFSSHQNYPWQQILGWFAIVSSGILNFALLTYFVLFIEAKH